MKKIVITGEPGVGKTTVIERVAGALKSQGNLATGFYTREIRRGGVREGFAIETLDGKKGILAHIKIGGPRVGRYGVDIGAIEAVILPAITAEGGDKVLIVIDEIGKMECLSPAFRDKVWAALDGDNPVLATIAKRGQGFIKRIKERQEIEVMEVSRSNRENLPRLILAKLAPTL